MATVSRRRATSARRPRDDDEDVEIDEEDDEEETPRRSRRRDKVSASANSSRRRSKDIDATEVDDEDDEDLDDLDDEEDEEEERPRRRKSSSRSTTKTKSRTRPARGRAEDDEEDNDDEEEPPRRRSSTRSASRTRSGNRRIPEGVKVGLAGAEEVRASGIGGAPLLALTPQPQLVKFLQNENAVSFRQHWINLGERNGGNRPFTCVGTDCPLCNMGDRGNVANLWNVLVFSGSEEPVVKMVRLGVKYHKRLVEQSTPRNGTKPTPTKNWWTLTKTGKGTDSDTLFKELKLRDVEEDWPEIFEQFDAEDLPDIIKEAKGKLHGIEVVETTPRKRLKEIARHLSEDSDDDDD